MTVDEVVEILRSYIRDGGAALEREYGPEVVMVAEDMEDLLEDRLEEESPYASLWDEFCATPGSMVEELTGALEALEEADPELAERLNAFIEEYHAAIAPETLEEEEEAELEDVEDIEEVEIPLPDVGEEPIKDPDKDEDQNYPVEEIYRDHDYDEEGTYLYGNFEPGIASIGEGVMTEELPEEPGELPGESLPHVERVAMLFAGLYEALDDRDDLSADDRRDVKAAVERLEVEIASGEARSGYERSLHGHLHEIEEMDPVTFNLVIDTLVEREAAFVPVAQGVALSLLQEEHEETEPPSPEA